MSPGNVWAIDELMWVRTVVQDPLVAFIPRKPHPLGIIVYMSGCLTDTHLPFMFDISPVCKMPKASGPMTCMSLIDKIPSNSDSHLVVDALFPTPEVKEHCFQKVF